MHKPLLLARRPFQPARHFVGGKLRLDCISFRGTRFETAVLSRSKKKQTEYVFTNEKGDEPGNHATNGIKKAIDDKFMPIANTVREFMKMESADKFCPIKESIHL